MRGWSIFNPSSKWLHLGLVRARMLELYYLVGLGETSLAQEVREKVVPKGKIYFLVKDTAISFLTQIINLTNWPT
jgi:hypothetical protein